MFLPKYGYMHTDIDIAGTPFSYHLIKIYLEFANFHGVHWGKHLLQQK
jgi:hypothetical protein